MSAPQDPAPAAPLASTRRQLRLLNHDGTFNVSRKLGTVRRRDIYHALLGVSWPRFLAWLVAAYALINAAFACAYAALGDGAIENSASGDFLARLPDRFYFSVQTFATIGYGKMTPIGPAANALVVLESLVGLLAVALATGLVYGRFSRPTARVLFSRRAIVAPHDGVPSLLFRMANERRSHIVEAEVRVILARNEVSAEGETWRDFHELALERDRSAFFSLSWTVVHPIDERSPLRGATPESLRLAEAEILVSLVGIEDVLSQSVHARFSYTADDLAFGGRFADVLSRDDRGIVMDLARFHEIIPQG